jgi:anaerobic magnesium-protoporphyrin IX monomethyl ester cyclase
MNNRIAFIDFYRVMTEVNSKPLMPLACLSLGSHLKRSGWDIKIFQICSPEQIDDIAKEVLDYEPFLVGISATFGVYTAEYAATSNTIKASNPNIYIVWGGVHAGSISDLCLQSDMVDFVIKSEGEHALLELCTALRDGTPLENVRNLMYKTPERKIVSSAKGLILENNIDIFALDFELLPDYEKYIGQIGNDRIFHALQTSRGCPWNCSFCYNSESNNRRWRPQSTQNVIQTVERLRKKVAFNRIRFVDDQFFANENRAMEIISKLYDAGIGVMMPDMRLENIHFDLLEFLKNHSFKEVFFGSESENDRILLLFNKGITNAKLIGKFQILSRYPSITFVTNFILGFPTNTVQEMKSSIRFALYWQKKIPNLKIAMSVYLPFPGTKMYKMSIENGYIPPESLDYYFKGFYLHKKGGLFKPFEEMDWLNVSPKYKRSLLHLNRASVFYSGLCTPSNKFHVSILKRMCIYYVGFLMSHLHLRAVNTFINIYECIKSMLYRR